MLRFIPYPQFFARARLLRRACRFGPRPWAHVVFHACSSSVCRRPAASSEKKDASTTKPPFSQCWYCIRCGSASQAKSRIRRCGRQFEMAGSAGVSCEFTAVVRPGRLQAFGLPDPDNSSWAGGMGGKNSRPQGANRVRRRPFGAAAGLRRAGRSVILLLGRLDDSAEGIQRRDDGEFVRDRRCQVRQVVWCNG